VMSHIYIYVYIYIHGLQIHANPISPGRSTHHPLHCSSVQEEVLDSFWHLLCLSGIQAPSQETLMAFSKSESKHSNSSMSMALSVKMRMRKGPRFQAECNPGTPLPSCMENSSKNPPKWSADAIMLESFGRNLFKKSYTCIHYNAS